jgi:hypothetical protein
VIVDSGLVTDRDKRKFDEIDVAECDASNDLAFKPCISP